MLPPKHIVSAATIVLNEQKEILLIKGLCRGWEMPGEQVEEGESLKDVQSGKQKKKLVFEVLKFCGVYQNLSDSI